MAINQQLLQFQASILSLKNHIDNTYSTMRKEVNSFIGKWGINGYQTLKVGTGQQFPSIQEAWDFLRNRQLDQDVLIKVDDGLYNTETGYSLLGHPQADRIRIEGNILDPALCVINYTGDYTTNPIDSIVGIHHCRGLNLSGFTIKAPAAETANANYRLVSLDIFDSELTSDAATIVIQDPYIGVSLDGSRYNSPGITVNSAGHIAYSVVNNSRAKIDNATLYTVDRTALITEPSTPFPTTTYGLYTDKGSITGTDVTIHTAYHGAAQLNGASVVLPGVHIYNCEYGVSSVASSVAAEHYIDGQGTVVYSKIENCNVAVVANVNSYIQGRGLRVDGVGVGFYANNSHILLNGSVPEYSGGIVNWTSTAYFAENGGHIDATGCLTNTGLTPADTILLSPSPINTYGPGGSIILISGDNTVPPPGDNTPPPPEGSTPPAPDPGDIYPAYPPLWYVNNLQPYVDSVSTGLSTGIYQYSYLLVDYITFCGYSSLWDIAMMAAGNLSSLYAYINNYPADPTATQLQAMKVLKSLDPGWDPVNRIYRLPYTEPFVLPY